MKSKRLLFASLCFLMIMVIALVACSSPNDSSNNDNSNSSNPSDNSNGSNPTGGTLVVNNGTYSNYTVTITFNNNEVFSGTMTPHETIRKTSSNDVEYKIIFVRQHPYSQSKIGSLSGGETVYYNLGE